MQDNVSRPFLCLKAVAKGRNDLLSFVCSHATFSTITSNEQLIRSFGFYRAMLRSARYCCGKSSVCLSVTLKYRDLIGWNYSKIISRLVSLGCSLFVDPNIMITDLLQGEHAEILPVVGEGYGKSDFRRTRTVSLISLKRGTIGPSLLLGTNRNVIYALSIGVKINDLY